jgi:ABC-type branched-subunit amino acid transport system substrate-binding protein
MRIVAIFLIFTFSLPNAFSQVSFSQIDENNYNLGLQSFRQGDYSTAYQYFQSVMKDSLNQRSAESFYYGTRCLFNLKNYPEAISVADTFLSRFPADEHRFEMFYILGAIYYEMNQYIRASYQFIIAIDSANDQAVRDRAVASLRNLVATNLSFDEVDSLFERCHTRLSAVSVAVTFARRAYFSDRIGDADRILKEFMVRYPQPGVGTGEVVKWISRIADDKTLSSAPIKIGALLPLEYGSGVGDKLLLGIQLALDDYNSNAPAKVGLVLENYGASSSKLKADMENLVRNDSVKAVIGPVFSNDVTAIAEDANLGHLPTITPTATQVGITSGNSYVFQGNPSFKTRASAVADYAVNVLHCTRIAVLSPSDTYGKSIASYFISRLKQLGLSPISVQYFESGATDLSQQILSIKNAAAAIEPFVNFGKLNKQQLARLKTVGIPQSYTDSLAKSRGIVDAFDLFGVNPTVTADSLGIPIFKKSSLDDLDPLRSVDAIFIPLTSSKDIGIIGAQLAYQNVKTQLLGTDDWYDLNQLSNNDMYIDGVIFCSDTYFDTNSPEYVSVSDSLSEISDMELDRTISYGYDFTTVLLGIIRSGNADRLAIASALKAGLFKTLHSNVFFDDDNSNHYLHILQFKGGKIINLGDVNTN